MIGFNVITILFLSVFMGVALAKECPNECRQLHKKVKQLYKSGNFVNDRCNTDLNDFQKAVLQVLLKVKNNDELDKMGKLIVNCNEMRELGYSTGNKYFCEGAYWCSAYAFETAHFFGNKINVSGDAWQLYLNNKQFRKWQAYTEDIDTEYSSIPWVSFPWSDKNKPPNGDFPYNRLKTGDIITIGMSSRGYASHAAVVIKDPVNCNKVYLLDNIGGKVGLNFITSYGNYAELVYDPRDGFYHLIEENPAIEVLGNKK